MPISLSYTDPNTSVIYSASYWVIDTLTFLPRISSLHVRMCGYEDSATYADLTKTYFAVKEFDITQSPIWTNTLQQSFDNIYNGAIATIPFFAGGTIV